MPRISAASNTPSIQPQDRVAFVNTRVAELQAEALKKHPNHSGTGHYSLYANSSAAIADYLKDKPLNGEASATFMSANADYQLLLYSYKTGEPMRAFLEEMPKNGKLELELTITPSGHNGADNAKKWAQSNTYNARVGYMENGRFKELDKVQFDSAGKETNQRTVQVAKPNFAPTSPALEVDLKQFRKDHPGKDLVLEGWPNGSAGVGGYLEARRTIIDVNV